MSSKKKYLILFIALIFFGVFRFSPSFAEDVEKGDFEKVSVDEEQLKNEEVVQEEDNSPAYRILGRKLTDAEEALYKEEDQIKNQLLYKEQKLVIVRALNTIGETSAISIVLERVPDTGDKTFSELIEFFTELKEKYGRVSIGVEKIYVSNIKDDAVAFNEAAHEAYSNVFCNELKDELEAKFLNYFKENEANTYSKMVEELQSTMNEDIKKAILFRVLGEIGRNDLKSNPVFVKKIIGQEFTCEELRELLKNLAR